MHRSDQNNPVQQELALRERLVKAYTREARFFEAERNLFKTSVALKKLGQFKYSSLEDLREQVEMQERFSLLYTMPKPAEIKVDPLDRFYDSVPLKQTKVSSKQPVQQPKKMDWSALQNKLEDLAQEQDEEELNEGLVNISLGMKSKST